MGKIYGKGLGVTQDYNEAREWFEKGAAQNNAEAQFHLGYCMQKDGESPKTIIEHVSGMKKQRHREKLSLNLS